MIRRNLMHKQERPEKYTTPNLIKIDRIHDGLRQLKN